MFTNYLKVALRNLMRYKAYSLITILGLAVGIAGTLLILIYMHFEMSYDNFHRHVDSIYRISIVAKKEGKVEFDGPEFTPPIGPAMKEEFPEVENYTRISTARVAYFSFGERKMKVDEIHHADSTFFDVLSFELVAGNPRRALASPYSIVLTGGTAQRLFGAENPLGRSVQLDQQESYIVTGIVKQPPANSHLQFNALISFSTLYKDPHRFMDWNGGNQYITYVKLLDGTTPEAVHKKFPAFMWRHINAQLATIAVSFEPYLQPLRDIHLYYDPASDSLRTNLAIIGVVALLILLIACVNFVNLTTARATRRAKEVGVRKVFGASRRVLIRQFLGESLLLSALALLIAIFLVELVFPVYRNVVGEELVLAGVMNLQNFGILFGLILIVGIVAGSYPAFYLSSFQAAETLRGTLPSGPAIGKGRSALVVLQFAISIALIVCTSVVMRQLHFTKTKELGFSKENILILPLVGEDAKTKSAMLKSAFLQLATVDGVAASSEIPRNGFTSNGYFPQGHDKPMMIHVIDVDEEFLKTYNIPLFRGRNFSTSLPTDKTAYLINETLANSLGWDDAIGKMITRNGTHQVIGVVKDFHFASLHSTIEPLIITQQPWLDQFDYLSVKVRSANISESLREIQEAWHRVIPASPFDYWFLDESFDQIYRSEQRFEQVFLAFSILSIVIALFGLLSLASFAAEQRTKEIGIRKVLGASVSGVTSLLSRDFVRLVLIANILGWPVAYYFMQRWLEDFAYRIDIEWWVFVSAGIATLLIALVTVSIQTLRVALANPVEALRYE